MGLLMEGVLSPSNCQESESSEEERVIRLFLLVRGRGR
jgi:hypothetical protein